MEISINGPVFNSDRVKFQLTGYSQGAFIVSNGALPRKAAVLV